MLQLIALAVASLAASRVLFKSTGLIVWLGAAGTIFQAQWLWLTLLHRSYLSDFSAYSVFTTGALVCAAIWTVLALHDKTAWRFRRPGPLDAAVIVVVCAVIAGASLVASANGFRAQDWVTSGFYNGDTVTFAALIQRSFFTPQLLAANPFAGNGPLEYPTLLHAGFASLFSLLGTGLDWFHLLPVLTFLEIAVTIPIFFLLWETVLPSSTRRGSLARAAVAAGAVAYILALSWDNYIYPQSHFFLTGLFVMLAALWAQVYPRRGTSQLVPLVAGMVLTLVLLRSNAVTGTAAVAITLVLAALRVFDRTRANTERAAFLLLIGVWAVLFMAYTPGQGAFGWPGLSYTAAPDMLRLSPLLLALLAAYALEHGRQAYVGAATVALGGLAIVTYAFSTRDIVVENASRFFYHAAIIGFPTLYFPLVRLWHALRREAMLVKRPASEWAVAVAGLAISIFIFLLPAAASMLHAFDDLLFKDTQVILAPTRDALRWVAENSSPDAVFLASPDRPWAIPLFTGRALLRTHYWLSPDDEVLQRVHNAFAGDALAQAQLKDSADYLFLTTGEGRLWPSPPGELVYKNSHVGIYRLR